MPIIKKSIHEYKGEIKKMAFLIKYRVDTANKMRKGMCLLKACFFQMKPRSLLFRAYLSIMQSLYNYEDLLFWGCSETF
jgi:hypothetical protein